MVSNLCILRFYFSVSAAACDLPQSESSPLTVLLKSVDLRDTVDICFTLIVEFVNGHCYGYNRNISN